MHHNHQYRDKPRFPNISDPLEKELKGKYDDMLVKMNKQLADKLKEFML